MKKILSGIVSSILIASFNVQAKEYLGFDLGNDSFEKVTRQIESQKIPFTIYYEKDANQNDIKELPIVKIKRYPAWEKYGKVDASEFCFAEGKLSTLYVAWEDKGDSFADVTKDLIKAYTMQKKKLSLFKTLEAAFGKKYEVKSAADPSDNFSEALYDDGKEVSIRLKRSTVNPTKNIMDSYYVTTVTYWENGLNDKVQKVVANQNKTIAEEKRKHDPDLQFAKDF